MKSIADLRHDYTLAGLDERDLNPDPIQQFDVWMTQAIKGGIDEPTAVTLATASRQGIPTARIILLKHFDVHGFCFFTNYTSAKGAELASNPHAALCVYWPALERQVRIVGPVSRTSAAESDEYFKRRPRGSQLGAWVSEQSAPIAGRQVLDDGLAAITRRFEGKEVVRPPHWGGYRVRHESIEFWQGRPSRLHDRLVYTRQKDGTWTIARLAP
jgi:pyridoxamine 5'-phosphate oxidase